MLINILHPALNSKVICSTVSTESYEPSNLLSSDVKKAGLGFLAYSCVKPPVELVFNFTCAFDFYYILIWPSVASQKSTGITLLTKKHGITTAIGSGFLSDEPGLLFYRNDIFSNKKLEDLAAPKNFYKATLRNVNNEILNCTNLIVKITKTANSSVPAISKLQIWGQVSNKYSADIISKINKIWCDNTTIKNEINAIKQHESANESDYSKNQDNIIIGNKSHIPDEFLDLITYNIMSIPLVLPSGKIIDKDTLDKHIKQEAIWGRPPSDPFTSLPFTMYRKPFISFALKGKIDKFLLMNSSKNELPTTADHFIPDQCDTSASVYEERCVNQNKNVTMENDCKVVTNTLISSISNNTQNSSFSAQRELHSARKAKHEFKKICRCCLVVRECYECGLSVKLLKINCRHFICKMCIQKLQKQHFACKKCGVKFSRSQVYNAV